MPATTKSLNSLKQIYTGDRLDLKKLADYLGFSVQQMATIAGVDRNTVYRSRTSDKVLGSLKPLIYAVKLLLELTEDNIIEVRRWFKEPLTQWRGLSPLDCLLEGKIDAVVQLVERISYGDSAGY